MDISDEVEARHAPLRGLLIEGERKPAGNLGYWRAVE
jgi:hypothetical protein